MGRESRPSNSADTTTTIHQNRSHLQVIPLFYVTWGPLGDPANSSSILVAKTLVSAESPFPPSSSCISTPAIDPIFSDRSHFSNLYVGTGTFLRRSTRGDRIFFFTFIPSFSVPSTAAYTQGQDSTGFTGSPPVK